VRNVKGKVVGEPKDKLAEKIYAANPEAWQSCLATSLKAGPDFSAMPSVGDIVKRRIKG
jgi:hypothetical protein